MWSWLKTWHKRTAAYQGPVLLLTGGIWDFYTLRLERLLDNGLLFAYLLVFAVATVSDTRNPWTGDKPPWRVWMLHLASQFALGGLLSAYLVHYLRGAPIQRDLLWLLVLATLAVGTELRPEWARQPSVRIPLLAIVVFHYFLAVIPLLTLSLIGGFWPMVLSGSMVLGTVVAASRGRTLSPGLMQAGLAGFLAVGTQVVLVVTDLVPPLPLTLMTAQVEAGDEGDFVELGTATEMVAPVGLLVPRLPWHAGTSVRMRTPVYLPRGMETPIVHQWEHYNGEKWSTSDTIQLQVRGGREEGFRTFSTKRRTVPGDWRVLVKTLDGRELGRIHFRLVPHAL